MMARLRLFLVLGRVSNGPTVWSNCLAAWWLSGGGPWKRFTWLGTGVTLLYIAGMFLNDACDAAFDRRYRPERPIPAGRISRRAVWGLGLAGLLLGWLVLLPLGASVAAWAGVLVGLDGLHPLSMGARVSVAGGTPRVTDGPYVETKEVLGGYWMIQVRSQEDAIEWAKRAPMLDGDMIEVRKVQELSDFPEEIQKAAGR